MSDLTEQPPNRGTETLASLLARHREIAEKAVTAKRKFEETDSMGDSMAADFAEYDCNKATPPDVALALNAVAEATEGLKNQPHAVTFHETGWELEHSLRCRVQGMRDCSIHASLKELDEAPVSFGRYFVYEDADQTLTYSLVYPHHASEDTAKDVLAALADLHEVLQAKMGEQG